MLPKFAVKKLKNRPEIKIPEFLKSLLSVLVRLLIRLMKEGSKIQPKKVVRIALALPVWFFVIGVILFLSYFIYLQRTLPDPETIIARKVGESTKIYDTTGEVLLYDIHGEEKRTIIPWDQIPESVKYATLV